MSIHIDAEQWPMAAGCIGLAKLYSKEELPRTSSGIVLSKEILDTLAEKYIRQLIQTFSIVRRDVRRMEWYADQAEKKPEQTKQLAAEVRKIMTEQFKKIEKYFAETNECQLLKELLDNMKDIRNPEDHVKIREAIEQYKKIIEKPFINEKLTLNYAKTVILNPFYGQTSILQPTFNSKTTEEHIAQIDADFIQPAKLELLFSEKLKHSRGAEEIVAFLEEYNEYKPFKDLLKAIKKQRETIEDLREFIKKEVLFCSFIDGLIATQSYEEMVFSPLSFSKNKAVNFNWDFDKQIPVPMSAVARLVMFMAPFGMAFYSRKIGNEQTNENLRFAGLILSQKHFSEVIKENIRYQNLRGQGSSFEEAIVGLLHETIDKAKKMKLSYFFLEVYSNYSSKKTLLDYYHMPVYLSHYLVRFGKSLEHLRHQHLRDAFFRAVLRGIDPKEVIFEYLRLSIKEPFHAIGAHMAIRERKRILEAKRGVEEMANFDKTISFVYHRGVDLRKKMVIDRSDNQDGEPYRASGRKKLEGISYRLLNATKAGNKNAFMDTVFRIHMAAGLDVPSIFVDSYKEEGLDFETISSAFIAGLLGQDINKKEEEEI